MTDDRRPATRDPLPRPPTAALSRALNQNRNFQLPRDDAASQAGEGWERVVGRQQSAVEMRVALNGWFLNAPSTGTGQYLRNLIRALAPILSENDAELTVIAPQSETNLDLPFQLTRPRLSGNLGKVEFEHLTFPRVCRRGNFTLAHIPHLGPPLFPSIPTVVTIHDLIPMILPDYRGSRAVRIYTRLAAAGARRAKIIIADSEASRRDILKHLQIPPERVRVVYLAADEKFQPAVDTAERERVRMKYSLPEEFVLYLGGLDVRKNLAVLIQAFAALRLECEAGWRLVIAGGLPARSQSAFFPDPRVLAQDARILDAVQLIGHVAEEDKPALYSRARALVYPSLYEGFGLPPLEAMACGTAVICSNSSSLPEVVGDAGILLPPREVKAWTEALRRVMRDEAFCRELRARGLIRAKNFSWERTARETFEVYRQVLTFGK